MTRRWKQTLQESRTTHTHVFTREDLAHISLEHLVADTLASQSTQTFLRQLADPRVSLWDAFVRSVQCEHETLQENDLFTPLKSLIEHTTQVAVLIPFAQLSDAWCFDRSKPDKSGEYPVLYWDHEQRLREEGVEYPSFEAWFWEEVIRGEFLEDGDEED